MLLDGVHFETRPRLSLFEMFEMWFQLSKQCLHFELGPLTSHSQGQRVIQWERRCDVATSGKALPVLVSCRRPGSCSLFSSPFSIKLFIKSNQSNTSPNHQQTTRQLSQWPLFTVSTFLAPSYHLRPSHVNKSSTAYHSSNDHQPTAKTLTKHH